jgi:hypothetical protein
VVIMSMLLVARHNQGCVSGRPGECIGILGIRQFRVRDDACVMSSCESLLICEITNCGYCNN